jgi:hypothetical protein
MSAPHSDPAPKGGRKFSERTFSEKLVYLGKLIISIATMGFAFPNLYDD